VRVAIATLGCKVNQYDTASIATALRHEGCAIVPFESGADVYIINSCTVTDRADAESRQLARRARRFGPQARLILTGCFAQTSPASAAIPEVDYVIGLNRLPDLVRAARAERGNPAQRILVDDVRTARQVRTLGAEAFTGHTRAFLKIQEGCDLFCSFCIVPFARGRSRSVAPHQVLEQLQRLAARGFQEVVLTGVHLGGYGSDLDPRVGLTDLLELIVEDPPLPRLRLSSIDPPEVTPRLLRLMARAEAICPHLHIPVQAAEDAVLRRMRRRYDGGVLRATVAAVRTALPSAAIGTDVIAGFPGETQDQFEATYALLEQLPFTYFHVFPYSRRTGTTAAKMQNQLPAAIVKQRARRLRKLGERKRIDFCRDCLGERLQVLVEEAGGRDSGWCTGLSRNYQRVEFPGPRSPANTEVEVRVVAAEGRRLIGRLEQRPST
jgi:threonylcarbamoyladenosine tRNA methylthiotransferase MtaB